STGWRLGIEQPYNEIIAPAPDIQRQVLIAVIGLIVVVLVISIRLAQRIGRPLLNLSRVAESVAVSVNDPTRPAGDVKDLGQVGGAKEITDLADAFGKMVIALRQRANEVDSIYALSQTITANVDFDQTLHAVM